MRGGGRERHGGKKAVSERELPKIKGLTTYALVYRRALFSPPDVSRSSFTPSRTSRYFQSNIAKLIWLSETPGLRNEKRETLALRRKDCESQTK